MQYSCSGRRCQKKSLVIVRMASVMATLVIALFLIYGLISHALGNRIRRLTAAADQAMVGVAEEFSHIEGSPSGPIKKIIRVMTFNTWVAGNNVHNGVMKIARNIYANDPHIVGLQEMNDKTATRLQKLLNELYRQDRRPDTWYHCRRNEGGLNHILTRFPISQEFTPSTYLNNNGCQLKIHDDPPRYVQVWNLYLNWQDYGPYAACNKRKSESKSMDEVLFYSEYKPKDTGRSRLHQTLRFLNKRELRNLDTTRNSPGPFVVVMGDFNSPSHLDWTAAASTLHCNISYEWPVSRLMADSGFIDSFRKVNDDPLFQPGATWTPIYSTKTWISVTSMEPEPQDRIDFIYYLTGNPQVNVRRSVIYTGNAEVRLFPHHADNEWPSDHASVITDFEFTAQ